VDEKSELDNLDLNLLKEDTTTESAEPSTSSSTSSTPAESVQQTPKQTTATTPASNKNKSEYNTPLFPSVALLLARNPWVNPFNVPANGKGGRILKGDMLKYLQENKAPADYQPEKEAPKQQPEVKSQKPASSTTTAADSIRKPKQSYTDIETSQMRKIIASRLLESKTTIPHSYVAIEAQVDKLLEAKTQLAKVKGVKVSVNDFVIYCAAKALQSHPECNAVFNKQAGEHKVSETIDISFAVATEKGLITPIIKKANTLSLQQISEKVKELGERAKAGKLKPDEFQGGSFCISNLGMFGIESFSAVINPPQAIIVAVGGSEKKPVLNTVDLDSDVYTAPSLDSIQFGTFMSLTASVDRRAVDEATAGEFMNTFKQYLELTLI
jgi:pyruvate dehydrogenase complex dihydrolipoamide acetyltransferase long form